MVAGVVALRRHADEHIRDAQLAEALRAMARGLDVEARALARDERVG
jgi:hypothetical protein